MVKLFDMKIPGLLWGFLRVWTERVLICFVWFYFHLLCPGPLSARNHLLGVEKQGGGLYGVYPIALLPLCTWLRPVKSPSHGEIRESCSESGPPVGLTANPIWESQFGLYILGNSQCQACLRVVLEGWFGEKGIGHFEKWVEAGFLEMFF